MKTENFQMFKLDLEKTEEQEINLPNIYWIIEKAREVQKNISASLTTLKPLTVWITTVENSERDGNTRPPDLSPEKPVCRPISNSYNQIWNDGLAQNWKRCTSRLYIHCHPTYLTFMKSTSCKMPGWLKHKLESRLPVKISITSDTQMTNPYGRKRRRT